MNSIGDLSLFFRRAMVGGVFVKQRTEKCVFLLVL